MFHLLIKRDGFTLKSTTGKMYLNGEYFGYTLEDVSRSYGVKINGNTCIAEGTYRVKISLSNRFKRDMPMIYSEDNGYELRGGGISFKGIRIHGGNTHKNTEGCPLVAENYINEDTIQGSLEKELTKRLKELGGEGFITIAH